MATNKPNEGDRTFPVFLVIPASIADLLDRDATVEDAIKLTHQYLHAMGEGDAPYLTGYVG